MGSGAIERKVMMQRIEELIKASGKSSDEVRRQAGLNRSFFADLRSGKAQFPRVDNLASAADVLGVSVEYLIGRSDK